MSFLFYWILFGSGAEVHTIFIFSPALTIFTLKKLTKKLNQTFLHEMTITLLQNNSSKDGIGATNHVKKELRHNDHIGADVVQRIHIRTSIINKGLGQT